MLLCFFFVILWGIIKLVNNMKNNKGFTLIELIVTIGIMILIGMIIVNNMSGLLSEQNDTEYDNFKKNLEESACIYVETKWDTTKRSSCKSNNNCSISVDELIQEGLIEDNLKDPKETDPNDPKKGLVTENQNKYKVNVRWVDNVKTCTMNG